MRIDENRNIEVESEEDYQKGIINDYGFTSDPKQNIYTKDLKHCVGLGLIKEADNIRKRGLIHVLYNQEFEREDKGKIILSEENAKRVKKVLENFLSDFEKNEGGVNIFKTPMAIMVYVRSLPTGETFEKINLRDEFTEEFHEANARDINRYENPMADYIKGWLERNNIIPYGSNATSNKKLPSILNMEDEPKEISYKEFSLLHDRIKIGMYNKRGILLNRNDYERTLEF